MKLSRTFLQEIILLTTFAVLLLSQQVTQPTTDRYHQFVQLDGEFPANVAWSPDGTRLAVTDFPTVSLFNTADWHLELMLPDASANEVVWSPDSSQLASVAGGDTDYPYESLYIRDAQTGEVQLHLMRPYEGIHDYPFILPMARLSWSPDGRSIASDSHALEVLLWDLDAEQVHTLGSHENGRVGETDWSPDSSQVVSGGGDGTIRIWDVTSGENLVTIAGAGFVDWHPTEYRIVGIDFNHNVCIWDTHTGEPQLCIQHDETVRLATWNTDGSLIATGGLDGIVRVWDAASGDLLLMITEHSDLITDLAWHPHQNILASTSYDGTVRVWQITR